MQVIACRNVLHGGAPILRVAKDEGGWQLLCGGNHADNDLDGAETSTLGELVARDPSLNELADKGRWTEAEREHPGGDWTLYDDTDDRIRENIREHGCHIIGVAGAPLDHAFAYSIGLVITHGQPEMLIGGLPMETMHATINDIQDRMAQGQRFADGDRVSGLFEGYEAVLRKVRKEAYADTLVWASRLHGNDDFEALQIVWPDRGHRFPWDEGYAGPQQPRYW